MLSGFSDSNKDMNPEDLSFGEDFNLADLDLNSINLDEFEAEFGENFVDTELPRPEKSETVNPQPTVQKQDERQSRVNAKLQNNKEKTNSDLEKKVKIGVIAAAIGICVIAAVSGAMQQFGGNNNLSTMANLKNKTHQIQDRMHMPQSHDIEAPMEIVGESFNPDEFMPAGERVKVPVREANDEMNQLKSDEKKVLVTFNENNCNDPFLPHTEMLATSLPKFDLIDPPEGVPESSDAISVMKTTISGILYDKYSPSAIINIDGSDYLVKKGDVINKYRVLSISKDQVMVQLGNNIYKAGVGEILADGELNYNVVSNLENKFGGSNGVDDVIISVKKNIN